jgi:alpha-L-rhamnosidase
MFSMFTNALPVWLEGREEEHNLTLQCKALCPRLNQAVVRIATSGLYNLYVNGVFVAYGPARAGKNHFRMDQIDIAPLLDREENTVVIEICGYNAYSFELQNQPSFLQAEIVSAGEAIAWTGRDFTARVHPFRRRKTQRYSFQRPYSEAYCISRLDSFLEDKIPGAEVLCPTAEKIIIPRYAPYPLYETADAVPQLSGTLCPIVPDPLRQRAYCCRFALPYARFPA